MTFRLTLDSPESPEIVDLIDGIFERAEHESRLIRRLAAEHPDYDPSLALVARDADDRPLAFALVLPRRLWIRGAWVQMAISSPVGVLPQARRSGAGRFLFDTCIAAMRDRGMRGAVVIGGSPFFRRYGFGPAFNLYSVHARREDLPAGRNDGWRGLQGDDLPQLATLYTNAYRGSAGCEQRANSAIEWESAIANSHCLAWEQDGKLAAYLRFRIRGAIELRECGVSCPDGVEAVLAFLGQLLDEHHRADMEAHLPPTHPVARALFHAGCLEQASNFEGEAMLRVLDWPGILRDTSAVWARQLNGGAANSLALEVDGSTTSISLNPELSGEQALTVTDGLVGDQILSVPEGWGPALLTGQRNYLDLAGCTDVREASQLNEDGWDLVGRLFPQATPMWSYAPVFELADG